MPSAWHWRSTGSFAGRRVPKSLCRKETSWPLLQVAHYLPSGNSLHMQKINDQDKPRAVLNLVDLSGSERLSDEDSN
jgi:hypothetical protein